MKATIGVYNDHEKAIEAVNVLKNAGYPANQISLLGHAQDEALTKQEKLDSDHEFDQPMKIAGTTVGISAVLGPVVGALAGIGLLAIPGLGFLVGAGAIAGAVAGLDIGLIGGGVISALAIAGVSKQHEDKYHEHLKEGRYLVVAHGSEEEVNHAKELLHEHDEHLDLTTHTQ